MKKLFMYALMIPAMAVSMVACSSSKVNVKQLDGKWNIVEVKGEVINSEENVPFMEFDMEGKKLHGNAGCNIFNTSVILNDKDDSALKIGQAAATMMACPNMDLETKIFQSMDAVRSVKSGKSENELLLVDENGYTLFVLSK